jgi:small subunit ribosomal protein S8
MITDPIADMLTRVRNASAAHKSEVAVPYSKLKWEIARILKEEGYISDVEKAQDVFPIIKITLKYLGNKQSAISKITRISKPGRRVYRNYKDMPVVLNRLGIAIVSTSRGIITNKKARQMKTGGEILCEVE